MKHLHTAHIDVNLDLPTQDLENLIDKATDAVVTIIIVFTGAQIVKSIFERIPN